MLNGKKVWQKIFFENFLIIISFFGIVVARIAGKVENPNFGIYNLVTLAVATIGFLFISFSKREQLKKKDFFNFGVHSQNPKDYIYYRFGYFLLFAGLILTFII